MNAEQYQLARSLFHELSDTPASKWDAVLRARNTTSEIKTAVCELLEKNQESSAFSETWLGSVCQVLLGNGTRIPAGPEGPDSDPAPLADRLRRFQSRTAAGDSARYRSEKPIGSGGMAEVIAVWDEDLRREVAMKLGLRGRRIDVADSPTEELVERFLREAQITGQLSHPGVVPVYELGVDDQNRVYFTMQLVTGRTLGEIYDLVVAEQDGWSETRALEVLVRVCDTMAYAHSKGIVHRDLKPANIMVGEFGEVYVMDWGVAKVLSTDIGESGPDLSSAAEETMAGSVLGTPSYMPPEQAMGQQGELTPRADVYALGALLYEVLTGHIPYVGEGERLDATAVLLRVRSGPPQRIEPLNPSVAPELVAICEKAMQRDPSERYQDATGLAEELRAYLEDRVVRAHATGPIEELRKWVRRNRAVAVAGLTAVAALVTGLMASLLFYGEARANEVQARSRLDDLLDLSSISILEDLTLRAPNLWPARQAKVAAMEQWIEEATVLQSHLPALEAKLDTMRTTARRTDDEPPRYEFSGDAELTAREKQWQHKLLSTLVDQLRRFVNGPEERQDVAGLHGTSLAEMQRRLAFSQSIAERTTTGPEVAGLWSEVIADLHGDERFAGITEPCVGLVPLDKNPETGLWEFWHVPTGNRPELRTDVGPGANRWNIGASTGMVMVLIPGGSYLMGCQDSDPDQPNYDPHPNASNLPVSEQTVEALFVSKYEMTQAQWLYITGKNVSRFYASYKWSGNVTTLWNPVERVSAHLAIDVLWDQGLRIPTETEWEHFTRAGTTSVWWTGTESASLKEAANIADLSMKRGGATGIRTATWDDGFGVHAPVGSFRANPFGLHDVAGNVFEWCYDYRHSDVDTSKVDPEFGILKGGDFFNPSIDCRSAYRGKMKFDDATPGTGVRPVVRIKR